jgi:hypothetical protein
MEMKNENSVIAISAWINPNASVRPVSVMMEQKSEAANLISFMMGQKNRRVTTVSFTEDVAKAIGIDVKSLEVGYDNASEVNINLSEILPFPVRIRVIESTDEVWARENYASIKKSGKDGVELVTSDGENIFRKQEFVQVATDGSSDDVFVAHVPLKDMGLDNTTTVTDEIKENKTEALTASSVF